MLVRLQNILDVWGSPDFASVFKLAVQQMDEADLPLQQALARSSHVSDSKREVVILRSTETSQQLQVKAGIFYAGVIAGSCCSDDPAPLCEENEYCELEFSIDRQTAETRIVLL